jgi:hypothetical protein
MNKDDLIALLDADWQKACALLMMQIHIEDWQFEFAIEAQFEYLFWHDEWCRLYEPNQKEYWQLLVFTGEFGDYE